MKRNKYVFVILFILFFSLSPHGHAEDPMVEPNEYQEKDIDIQTEYFHEEDLLEQKRRLPEEQKDLTFERGKYDVLDSVKDTLFLSPVAGNDNTIASKAEQLGLFSEVSIRTRSEEETEPLFNFDLTILLGVIVALSVGCLFFILIPKMGKLNGDAKRK
ncbi:type VII secretion protein EssA [Peribacillus muralis]|uniref:type VII secretion protein EssA n=1 Tax=Peribacillus muralis TaxID=264697 RepID=UPI001F4EEC0E|nr:type VII secretion protein EssA [Peribacillus muralis]MCK1994974.1 type VII secretion protein EssA [Peribacillus muralis]MCK2015480.1 type VII secretion protein EssA [Peribacillus muralis]